jgi:hypothetical protein
VYFGQNLIHRGAGELAVGAAAVVLEHRRPLVLGG